MLVVVFGAVAHGVGTELEPVVCGAGTEAIRAEGTELARAVGTGVIRAVGTGAVHGAGPELELGGGLSTRLVTRPPTELLRVVGDVMVICLPSAREPWRSALSQGAMLVRSPMPVLSMERLTPAPGLG